MLRNARLAHPQTSFRGLVKRGTLEVVTSDGRIFKVGDGATPKVGIRFCDAGAEWALCLDPELKLGELYIDGRLLVERGSFYEFLQLVLQDSHGELDAVSFQWLRRLLDMGRRVARGTVRPDQGKMWLTITTSIASYMSFSWTATFSTPAPTLIRPKSV